MKTYLVFGAAGSIGSEVVSRLVDARHRVIALVRGHHMTEPVLGDSLAGAFIEVFEDVSDRKQLKVYTSFCGQFNGIIYAVGHCPPGGIVEAIRHPLSQLPLETYQNEIRMHQLGVLNVFQCLLPCLMDGGCFVFLSSAITRLKGKFPPFLQAHYHASVISAEDWLVDGMRHDPAVAERKIKIHRLAPQAVDTPFHRGWPELPALIPVCIVAKEVVRALESDEHVDKELL